MATISALDVLSSDGFETAALLKKALALASRKLAEFKGVAASIPNQRASGGASTVLRRA